MRYCNLLTRLHCTQCGKWIWNNISFVVFSAVFAMARSTHHNGIKQNAIGSREWELLYANEENAINRWLEVIASSFSSSTHTLTRAVVLYHISLNEKPFDSLTKFILIPFRCLCIFMSRLSKWPATGNDRMSIDFSFSSIYSHMPHTHSHTRTTTIPISVSKSEFIPHVPLSHRFFALKWNDDVRIVGVDTIHSVGINGETIVVNGYIEGRWIDSSLHKHLLFVLFVFLFFSNYREPD